MAIPPRNQQTPTRAVRSFAVGRGSFFPQVSTAAKSDNQTSVNTTPHPIVTSGVDSQTGSIPVPALLAGTAQTFSVTIPFPNLPATRNPTGFGPAPIAPYVTQRTDRVSFTTTAQVTDLPDGLVLQFVSAQPRALSGGQIFHGSALPGGQTYAAFQAVVSVKVLASVASSAGRIAVSANGSLVVQPG